MDNDDKFHILRRGFKGEVTLDGQLATIVVAYTLCLKKLLKTLQVSEPTFSFPNLRMNMLEFCRSLTYSFVISCHGRKKIILCRMCREDTRNI